MVFKLKTLNGVILKRLRLPLLRTDEKFLFLLKSNLKIALFFKLLFSLFWITFSRVGLLINPYTNIYWYPANISTSVQRCFLRERWNLQRSTTSEQRYKYDHLKKIIKPGFKIIILSFKEYAGLKIFFIFPHFKRNLQNLKNS